MPNSLNDEESSGSATGSKQFPLATTGGSPRRRGIRAAVIPKVDCNFV